MTETPRPLQIGEAADRLGLSIPTLRHWEEVGLVSPAARSKGGFRLYSERDLERLEVAKAMKPLGLSLEEMTELLDLVELARDPDVLDDGERVDLMRALQQFSAKTEETIRRLVRDMGYATTLLGSINTGIRRCSAPAPSANRKSSR